MWQRACLFITQLALEGACSKVSLEDVIGEVCWPKIAPNKLRNLSDKRRERNKSKERKEGKEREDRQ